VNTKPDRDRRDREALLLKPPDPLDEGSKLFERKEPSVHLGSPLDELGNLGVGRHGHRRKREG